MQEKVWKTYLHLFIFCQDVSTCSHSHLPKNNFFSLETVTSFLGLYLIYYVASWQRKFYKKTHVCVRLN